MSLPTADSSAWPGIRGSFVPGAVQLGFVRLLRLPPRGLWHLRAVGRREKKICGVATLASDQVRWLRLSSRDGFARSRPTVERRRVSRSPVNLDHRRWSGFPGSTRGWPASSFKMSSVGLMTFVARSVVEQRSVASLRSFRRDEQIGENGEG